MLLTFYFISLIGLVLAELTKGLSANGTPPFLQKMPGQMHLAHFCCDLVMLRQGGLRNHSDSFGQPSKNATLTGAWGAFSNNYVFKICLLRSRLSYHSLAACIMHPVTNMKTNTHP